ncbi:MAG: 5'-nucleotidase SurE [Rhodomicrobium sp.]|nr:MAG: 5'-nucleotidase SurE [Rhodomicrobium sp.]
MRILVTNDDGIDAQGIEVLGRIAQQLSDDVWVVAPALDNSGASHSLSLKDPLRSRQLGEQTFAVEGTPTDCVIMAVRQFMGDTPPDLILSGINHGQNIADDVTYSGTIAGAIEGALLGIPSIALSLTTGFEAPGSEHWETPEALAVPLIQDLLKAGWGTDVLMNVNFPDCSPQDVKGRIATRQGRRDQSLLAIDARQDPRGRDYYWFDFQRKRSNPAQGTDLWAVYNNYISVTPLHLDLTHHETTAQLERLFTGV